jgi:hypothetical protein
MAKRVVRQIRIEGNIAYVPLTRGYEAIIDAADIQIVSSTLWQAVLDRNTIYASRSKNSCHSKRDETTLMHRLIMSAPKGLLVDHINRNGLDNRRTNLRIATNSENLQNQKRRADNSSGVKGVTWKSDRNTWRAQIRVGERRIHLGYFTEVDEAAKAYRNASIHYHGEFGRVS